MILNGVSSFKKEEGEIYKKWQAFDLQMAEDYYNDVPPYEAVAIPAIVDFYRKYFPQHTQEEIPLAIDVACGSGQFTNALADCCTHVIGCDISSCQIKVAQSRARKANVSFEIASAYELSRLLSDGAKVDLMTVGTASHYFNNADFYNQARFCLKKGGLLAESIFVFKGVDGIPDSAIEELRVFLRSVVSDKESNAAYEKMYSITRSGYHDLNVLLDDVERKELPFTVMWGPTEWTNYLISCRPKSHDFRRETQMFYENMWLRYTGSLEPRASLFSVVVVFSRNMDPDKRH